MAFLGMRGTGDWAANERPENWRQGILRLYPNGMAPLTAILSKMKNSSTDDPVFHWWTKSLASQGGAVTAGEIYTDAAMTAAAEDASAAGAIVYVKVTQAIASEFRAGHQVLLRDASDYEVDVNGKVSAVNRNGDNSCITVELLEADDNSATHGLSDVDRILIIGNINPEGGSMPDSISYDSVEWYNNTQIFRTPLEITRTAKKTHLRTEDAYKEAKREALEIHSIEIEKNMLWSVRTSGIGANGKPERTTMGLITAIKAGAAANCNNFSINADYSGLTWLQGGEEWLDAYLEQIFRFGSGEKLAFVGSGALLGITRLIKSSGQFQITGATTSYGIKVLEWKTPFGMLNMITHPLFSFEATNRNSMVIFEPRLLEYKYIDDTFFKKDQGEREGGWANRDGTKDEFLTEAGLEYHHPTAMGYLNGFNTDNSV